MQLSNLNEKSPHKLLILLMSYIISLTIAVVFSVWLTPAPSAEYIAESLADTAQNYPLDVTRMDRDHLWISPEPHEFARYILFWVFFVSVFLITYTIINRTIGNKNIGGYAESLFGVCLSLCFLYFIINCYITAKDSYINVPGFFISRSFFNSNVIYPCIIVATFILVLYFTSKLDLNKQQIIFFTACAVLTVITAYICYRPNPYQSGINHVNYYFTSIYSIWNGASIGNEIQSVYGAQGYLMAPFFAIFGFSYKNFALLIAILCAFIMVGWFFIIKTFIKKPIYIFVFYALLIYVLFYFSIEVHTQFFNQYLPHRAVFSVLILLYIIWEQQRKIQKPVLYAALGYTVCGFALIMNVESGLACTLSYFFKQIYAALYKYGIKSKKCWFTILLNILGCIFSAFIFIFVLWLIAFLHSGVSIDIVSMISTQLVFAKLGNGAIAQPTEFNLYMLVYAGYAFSAAYLMQKLIINSKSGKDPSIEDTLLFSITILGIALLVYYTGRSAERTMLPIIWPFLIIVCVFIYKMLNIIKNKPLKFKNYITALSVICLPVLAIITVMSASIIYIAFRGEAFKNVTGEQGKYYMPEYEVAKRNLINNYLNEDGSIDYIGSFFAPTLAEMGIKNNYKGETTADWFMWEDYEYVLKYLSEFPELFLIEQAAINALDTYENEAYRGIIDSGGYELIDESSDIKVYSRV